MSYKDSAENVNYKTPTIFDQEIEKTQNFPNFKQKFLNKRHDLPENLKNLNKDLIITHVPSPNKQKKNSQVYLIKRFDRFENNKEFLDTKEKKSFLSVNNSPGNSHFNEKLKTINNDSAFKTSSLPKISIFGEFEPKVPVFSKLSSDFKKNRGNFSNIFAAQNFNFSELNKSCI